ncbi:MAG TPA: DUF4172 domain-containing protein, partial [Bryobacteraceae bacterium]|nr:DUF4172 domain-containing protein [Bryobacteraceae bacterium]
MPSTTLATYGYSKASWRAQFLYVAPSGEYLDRRGDYKVQSPHEVRRMYIHERKDWPDFHWNIEKLAEPLASVRYRQGGLIGQM